MAYKFYNANPHGNRIEDCVIRCMSVLTNRSWRSVYDEMSYLAGNESRMFDNVVFVEDYLDDRYPRECHYAKTVGEFVEEHPYGKYAITMNGHITPVINGTIYDTFNPSNRIMRCAWKVR